MKMQHILIALCLSISAFLPTTTMAASQDECAIWLCLPAGFPSGCGGAKSAFKNRIKHHKSPLPAFSSCAVNNSSMSYDQGKASWVPANNCKSRFGNMTIAGCTPTAGHWEKGTGNSSSCIMGRCSSKNYIQILEGGKSIGDTYYY